ncbi:MAG: hypothetical protein IPN15_17615 [Saprospiraceae bacterium]|nr:hypothetical protein [Candidatus Vicinibacter affinis]
MEQSGFGLAVIVPATGWPEHAVATVPVNSSAPISGVVAFLVLPSKSVVIPATAAPPLSNRVGFAGSI